MSATTTRNSNTTNAAGVPPAPPEAHQRSAFEGATRTVVLNRTQIVMHYRNDQWWNDRVSAA
jgi:hypothetical protein